MRPLRLRRVFTSSSKDSMSTLPLSPECDSQSPISIQREPNAPELGMFPQHDYLSPPQFYPDQRSDREEDRPPSSAIPEFRIPPPPMEKSAVDTSKKSKLSKLADSRSSANAFQNKGPRTFAVDSASVLTYPILRPSPASHLSLDPDPTFPEASASASSHIQRAVNAAIEQERLDKLQAKSEQDPQGSRSSRRWTDDVPSIPITEAPRPVGQQPSTRGPSKLAMLAQSKSTQRPEAIVSWVRPPSATPRRSRVLEAQEHNIRTKFVTPIHNGPTATTAITTSYQSLGNLMSRGVSDLPPSFPPPTNESKLTPSRVLVTSRPEPSSSLKPPLLNKSTSTAPSKLAMKIIQAQQRGTIPETDVLEEAEDPATPIFIPPGEPQVRPSSFASVLLDEDETSRRKKGLTPPPHRGNEEAFSIKTAGRAKNPPVFAFDVPSPDDIVFNARKGTTLAQRADSRIKSSRPKRISSTT